MRVGFLFNHYALHQVFHAAPYAFELSRNHPGFEVVLACSTNAELALVRRIGRLYPGHRCEFKRLRAPKLYRVVDPIVQKWSLLRKEMVLRHNLGFFRSLDGLVAPERHCFRLRSHHGLEDLSLIHARHGAGDRKGGFDSRSGVFDLTMLPGQKYVDRLGELGLLDPDRYVITGWPKFDVVRDLRCDAPPLFENDNPVVVYNPHFDQRVSSWKPMGLQVLDFFAEHRDYNLIFAPHVVLFKRSRRHRAVLPGHYEKLPNLWIDKGSSASCDMSYMLAADIYLGDVSSQIYEFLLEPRPCIFLNGHRTDWRADPFYFHWTLGQVVDDVTGQLGPALARAARTHAGFLLPQRAAFAYTFRQDGDQSAARRGADAIAEFLERRCHNALWAGPAAAVAGSEQPGHGR
jgi:CDP-glycerol glycerophosphotransferase (TagB/SpsB family)